MHLVLYIFKLKFDEKNSNNNNNNNNHNNNYNFTRLKCILHVYSAASLLLLAKHYRQARLHVIVVVLHFVRTLLTYAQERRGR